MPSVPDRSTEFPSRGVLSTLASCERSKANGCAWYAYPSFRLIIVASMLDCKGEIRRRMRRCQTGHCISLQKPLYQSRLAKLETLMRERQVDRKRGKNNHFCEQEAVMERNMSNLISHLRDSGSTNGMNRVKRTVRGGTVVAIRVQTSTSEPEG
ncbi:uncharacterized protein BKA78DRAFT_40010 [Phyllosticta capitalensis]|uniref:uncharacterized protein n=1 Tax=Phyllosticta capitalensis TaxID=121624 RepID=UPI003131233B